MKIIKRNGSEVDFDIEKVLVAISKANDEVPEHARISKHLMNAIAEDIQSDCAEMQQTPSVEDIQDMVENYLIKYGAAVVARAYITYRYTRELARKANTTDEEILSLIELANEEAKDENSNKNPTLAPTQRDYMAGAVSKDLTTRILLPQDIVEAHKAGIIHFHDADYFAQHIHNCFTGGTRFVTDSGIRQFRDFHDGDIVTVKDKDGVLREATVHKYGEQKMQKVELYNNKMTRQVICTPNHRWILSDGSVTTELKVGDVLYPLQDSTNVEINTVAEAKAFCMGFIVGDGTDAKKDATQILLCGDKSKYLSVFEKAGFHQHKNDGADIHLYRRCASKQDFLNAKAWRFLPAKYQALVFAGYYAADGNTKMNRVTTSDERVCLMIEETSALAGYHITSNTEEIRDTEFKKDSKLYYYYFMTNQSRDTSLWRVRSITPDNHGLVDAWCVEEPVTHTFTLEGGVVTGNCDVWNLEDMLQNGTVISNTLIEKPHSFYTACNITTQIVAQVASSQYGGQTFTLAHLVPFVEISRQKLRGDVRAELEEIGVSVTDEKINNIAEKRLKKEIASGVQTIQYQLVTLMTTNGQAPFVSVFMYLDEVPEGQERDDLAMIIEEVLKQRIQGVKNEKGVWVTTAFPKLLYVLDEDNIHPDSKYWDLTTLAARCTAKRMVPDYISAKVMSALKGGDIYPCMGCRSFLTPDRFTDKGVGNIAKAKNYVPGKHKYYGRFNQGVVTISLPDVALSSRGNVDEFWKIFEERLELCHKALRLRHERLKGTVSDVAPILWQHGALARLEKGETIDKLLYDGYSTISLGFAGLYECVKYMTGHSHTDDAAKDFALAVMQKMNDKCGEWKAAENIDYSVYGTPLESTTYKFATALEKRFPEEWKKLSGKDYITNSYHVVVTEEIDAFTKLKFEADFQRLAPGGAISYVEVPNMQQNIPAVLEVMKFIYDNIMYAELNTKSDYCMVCGYDGEIQIVEDADGKLDWECPNCKNRNHDKMSVSRRTCGYIGTNFWNQGRTQEIRDRVLHL